MLKANMILDICIYLCIDQGYCDTRRYLYIKRKAIFFVGLERVYISKKLNVSKKHIIKLYLKSFLNVHDN